MTKKKKPAKRPNDDQRAADELKAAQDNLVKGDDGSLTPRPGRDLFDT